MLFESRPLVAGFFCVLPCNYYRAGSSLWKPVITNSDDLATGILLLDTISSQA